MKLEFQNLSTSDQPITSVAEYLSARYQYDELSQKIRAVQLEMKTQREQGKKPNSKSFADLRSLRQQRDEIMQKFFRCQPYVLISRCPYCSREIWVKVGIFSLVDEFWYRKSSDGRDDATPKSRCPHLFCIDGALNLNGYQPTEAIAPISVLNDTIKMATETPFVKPRVLSLPTMVAVFHSIPVADKYTAYPIVYFMKQRPPQDKYCIGWARQEYVDHHKASGSGVVITGKRIDAQDYELKKWAQQGKLLWLDPTEDKHPLVREPIEAFPYYNVAGRQNPYIIKNGQVTDLPNPAKDGKPENHLEW